jgi:hypothetical protein
MMRHAPLPGGIGRHVMRAPRDRDPVLDAALPAPLVWFVDLPFGKVRLADHALHLVSTRNQMPRQGWRNRGRCRSFRDCNSAR